MVDDASESFESYARARIAALSWIAYMLTGDHHAAEDLVQQSLLRVVGRWRRLVATGDPDAYVRRVLYTQHVSRWRRNRVPPATGGYPDRVVPDPSGNIALAGPSGERWGDWHRSNGPCWCCGTSRI